MNSERIIMKQLDELSWKRIHRALESRIYELYQWREKQQFNPEIVAECDREMQALYNLIEEIKVK